MRRIELEELKQIQMQILDEVAAFCEKENIRYWLDSGTLIGAVRHKGYIPWDDDIDLGMLRPDFDRFMATFNRENSPYQFRSYESDKTFPYPYGKVLDMRTVLYEPDKNGEKLSVNIDIFVFDNAPDDEKILKKMYDKRDKCRARNAVQALRHKPRGSALRRIFIYLCKGVLKLFPRNHFIGKMVKNSKKYADVSTARVGNFTGFIRTSCDRRVFDDFVKLEFEGKKYNAPAGYDEWLRAFYGDYMQLPPEEKRVSHHQFEAYRKEEKENV